MKKSIYFVLCCFIVSCQIQRHNKISYFSIYVSPQSGEVLPSYLILKTQPKSFEIYSPGIWLTSIGDWSRENDTLYLTPRYEYSANRGGNNMKALSNCDSTMISIPQKYLVQGNKLIDKTDYKDIVPYFSESLVEMVYIKIK